MNNCYADIAELKRREHNIRLLLKSCEQSIMPFCGELPRTRRGAGKRFVCFGNHVIMVKTKSANVIRRRFQYDVDTDTWLRVPKWLKDVGGGSGLESSLSLTHPAYNELVIL